MERVQWSAGTVRAPIVPGPSSQVKSPSNEWWDKESWEAQWEGSLSQEVALHLRRRRRSDPPRRTSPLSSLSTIGQPSSSMGTIPPLETLENDEQNLVTPPCASASFDPLHLPSLVAFSFSLFGVLRSRVARSLGLYSTAATPTRAASSRERKKARGRSFGYRFGIGFALMSALCAGVGIGFMLASRI